MRGISFTSAPRPDKPTPSNPRASTSLHPSIGAARMMKKLSTTFRRKTNVSPTNIIPSVDAQHNPSSTPSPEPVSDPVSDRARILTRPSATARAMTFSAGTRVDTKKDTDIPFFGDREDDSPSDNRPPTMTTAIAAVRGKPAWMRDGEDDGKSKPPMHPRQMSHQPRGTAPVLRDTNRPDADYARSRHYSFDGDRSVAQHKSSSGARAPAASGRRRRPSRRRWLLPLHESPDEPRLFTPPAGSAFERIAKHRDRAEAKVLVSASTYLEAELQRINEQMKTRDGCCGKEANKCECGNRTFLVESGERMRNILCILEDRYDSIEQVYVKSEEYARAMGKFFQVTPDEFTRMISQRDMATGGSKKSLKALR